MMYMSWNDVVAVELPYDNDGERRANPIVSFPDHLVEWRTVGLFDSLDYQTGSERCFLRLLKYPWEPASDEGLKDVRISSHEVNVRANTFPPELQHFNVHSFHPAIGRLVLISRVNDLLHVYDLTPVSNSKVKKVRRRK